MSFVNFGGSIPLSASVTGCKQWPFSMGKNLVPPVSQGQLRRGVWVFSGSQNLGIGNFEQVEVLPGSLF